MTAEQKEAAIKEALKKRNAGANAAQKSKEAALLAAKLEKVERKTKASKKAAGTKGEDFDR